MAFLKTADLYDSGYRDGYKKGFEDGKKGSDKKYAMTVLEDEKDSNNASKLSKEKEDQKCQP